jgi:hypothetical protein
MQKAVMEILASVVEERVNGMGDLGNAGLGDLQYRV